MQSTLETLLRRIGHTVIVLLLLSLVIFSFIRLIPGDPVRMSMGPMVPDETIQKIRHELKFDQPMIVQYGYWLKQVVTKGDFGFSLYTHRSVTADIAEFLPRSLEFVLYTSILILIFGVLFGTVSALYKNKWIDNVVRFLAYLGVVTPPYAFGILFMLLFSFILRWFPLGGMPSMPAEYVKTGMMGLDALLAGDIPLYFNVLKHLFLPALSLSLGGIAYQARIHRSAMITNIDSDYVAFARVNGIRERTVVMKHLMKPSFIPTLTIFGLQVASLLGNAFLIEVIFRYPGFSQYSLNVIMTKDPYGIVAVTFVFGVIFSLANFLIDLGVAWIDPRIRLKGAE